MIRAHVFGDIVEPVVNFLLVHETALEGRRPVIPVLFKLVGLFNRAERPQTWNFRVTVFSICSVHNVYDNIWNWLNRRRAFCLDFVLIRFSVYEWIYPTEQTVVYWFLDFFPRLNSLHHRLESWLFFDWKTVQTIKLSRIKTSFIQSVFILDLFFLHGCVLVKFETIVLVVGRGKNFDLNFGFWKRLLFIHIIFWLHFIRNRRTKFLTLSIWR